MQASPLTVRNINVRAVVLTLERPIVARIATIADWPLILVDLETEEGIIGRSYIAPLLRQRGQISCAGDP